MFTAAQVLPGKPAKDISRVELEDCLLWCVEGVEVPGLCFSLQGCEYQPQGI